MIIISKASDLLEKKIVVFFEDRNYLPENLPNWMLKEGYIPNDRIIEVEGIGSKDKENKTDVFVKFEKSKTLKISVKLTNADYFGNWYGHKRFLKEFGEKTLNSLSNAISNWANSWITKSQSKFFVGVSICFGKRSGETALEFLDFFSINDIKTIVAGYDDGELNLKNANSLYISNTVPENDSEFFKNLTPINDRIIKDIASNFKVACRPINPSTEGTNRGKNVYTKFIPFQKLKIPRIITKKSELLTIGKFYPIDLKMDIALNHNHIIKNLKDEYNIIIHVKDKR